LQVIATSIAAVPPQKLVVITITCAEALHLFSTKLLKNELQFQLQVPFLE
jgi:hypothetical protein